MRRKYIERGEYRGLGEGEGHEGGKTLRRKDIGGEGHWERKTL